MDEAAMKYYRPPRRSQPTAQRFMFATGIECSYPTIETARGTVRQDEMAKCDHYGRWREDFVLTRELGVNYLRYGPPYYRIHAGPGKYDWAFTDEVLPVMRELGIVPIMDLCHFGVPDWLGNFQNPDLPGYFREYARAFAARYPWVRLYTPMNEMYIAAEFSAYYGWWNERLRTHRSFVTALKHIVRASYEAMLGIIEVRPDALFVLCESSEHTHANDPAGAERAEMFNDRCLLSLDLTCGRHVGVGMYEYLRDNGVTEDEYAYFMRHDLSEHFVMGHDYYPANEKLLVGDEDRERAGERVYGGDVFGYYVLARKYHERYRLPVMHTETNAREPGAVAWLWKTWANIQQLRRDGMPVCGMTWYSLTDQVDWDTALREENNRANPLGLYDLDRRVRPVGREYKRLIELWRDTPLLPGGPLVLVGAPDV
jgi:beta-glucosidase